MTVKVIENFYDVTDDRKLRKKGEELKVTKERGEYLVQRGLVEVIPKAKDKSVKDTSNK